MYTIDLDLMISSVRFYNLNQPVVKHGESGAEETSGSSAKHSIKQNFVTRFRYLGWCHLPIGGSAPLKFAMFINNSRMSGWAGGKNTILEILT